MLKLKCAMTKGEFSDYFEVGAEYQTVGSIELDNLYLIDVDASLWPIRRSDNFGRYHVVGFKSRVSFKEVK